MTSPVRDWATERSHPVGYVHATVFDYTRFTARFEPGSSPGPQPGMATGSHAVTDHMFVALYRLPHCRQNAAGISAVRRGTKSAIQPYPSSPPKPLSARCSDAVCMTKGGTTHPNCPGWPCTGQAEGLPGRCCRRQTVFKSRILSSPE